MILLPLIFTIILSVSLSIYMNHNKYLKDQNVIYAFLYFICVRLPKMILSLVGIRKDDENDYVSSYQLNANQHDIKPRQKNVNVNPHYAHSKKYMYDENDHEKDVKDIKIITDPKIVSKLHI